MMPTSHPPSLTPSFIHSFSGQLHAQEDASGMARVPSRLSAQSLLLMLQEGGPFNPPQMQAHPKGQGIYAPREICREWRLEPEDMALPTYPPRHSPGAQSQECSVLKSPSNPVPMAATMPPWHTFIFAFPSSLSLSTHTHFLSPLPS